MTRILLILPHLPQRLATPYLGQMYVAASLVAAGFEVRCLDMAASRYSAGVEGAVALADEFRPEIIGLTLFTYNARRGYELAAALEGRGRTIVAGGPHVTVRPTEPLEHGVDYAIAGEGERAIVALAEATSVGRRPAPRAGLATPNHPFEPPRLLDDLDGLAFPMLGLDCVDRSFYPAGEQVRIGGMMTSRGCPARCTFCSNAVTGRQFRYRSAANVVEEMAALREAHGTTHFAFFDDAFTAYRPRLEALCAVMTSTDELSGATWSCLTPANMVSPADLETMWRAGCRAVNFGIESGDPDVLRAIKKGQRPKQVVAAVRAAKSVGMTTVVNFMFGFPGETRAQLATTRRLMEDLSADVNVFNTRGVLVPFPGTPIYERTHADYEFTDWWLDPAYVRDEPEDLDADAALAAQGVDPTLALDFFRYDDDVRDAIAELVAYKANHNRTVLRRKGAVSSG